MSWILSEAVWTGTGVDDVTQGIDILNACKNALLNNEGATWELDTDPNYSGMLTYGTDAKISYGYYFVAQDTNAKLCMIYTYTSHPFSVESYIQDNSGSNSSPQPPVGLAIAMIPPNANGISWGSPDWTTATWLPDIGLRITGCCYNDNYSTNRNPLSKTSVVGDKYSYYFLCNKDTFCLMFRSSGWQYKPWQINSYEHTRGVLIGNIYQNFGYTSDFSWSTYGSVVLGGYCSDSSPYGRESMQSTSSSKGTYFRNSSAIYYITTNYTGKVLIWQCFNSEGVLCLSAGTGIPYSIIVGERNRDIRVYEGGGFSPFLGISDNINYIAAITNQRVYQAQSKFYTGPIVLYLHYGSNPLNTDGVHSGIYNGCGLKGFLRTDLALGLCNPPTSLGIGGTCNSGSYIRVSDCLLLGWDSSNENIFIEPPQP